MLRMNTGFIDEFQLVVAHVVLWERTQFKDVRERSVPTSLEPKPLKSGMVRLIYSV
jgi:hypothetical protein